MIQRFRFGLPLPTDSVVQEIPVSAGPVPFLTAEEDGWAYRMAPDAIVYGLGEMPRGINKRGWHYVTNNTDEARHSEDKLSYYGAHNFLLIDGGAGRECFGVFIDFPGKVRYDIGYTEYDALRFATEEPDHELYIITGDDLNMLMDNKELPPLDTNGKPAPTTAKAKPAKPAAEFVIEPDNSTQAAESKPESTAGTPETKTDASRNNSNDNDR